MKGKTVAIVQARMGSIRLPGKTLLPLGGQPLIWWVLTRVLAARTVDEVVVSTTVLEEDSRIVKYVTGHFGIPCFRGSPLDLVSRYYECALDYRAQTIVRITADDPFKDPRVIDDLVTKFNRAGALDLCTNVYPRRVPLGIDTEVLSMQALSRIHREAESKLHREHLTSYVYSQPSKFLIQAVTETDEDLSHYSLTLDDTQDYDRLSELCRIFLTRPLVSYDKVIRQLKRMNPTREGEIRP